ncbi:DUF4230 domain-containing protein [Romboutsia sp. 13368]|uniref:DUF4230 domain-containing protein n=1 Tax=Romboutsia sp. 13368 TaxID=2708053 RepID=UPI0025ED25D3|nr:DUF4230 domain-containing protein [Romboutsia sp. 13368]
MLQKRKKFKKVHVLLFFFIILASGALFIFNEFKKESTYKDSTKIMDTLNQVLHISTVKYNYSNIVEIKKDKSINNITIPFTEKTFIIKYNGVINGGVKPEDIEITNNTEDEIDIEIKKCQILDHYIDDENIYVYDIKNSIFNKLDTQEILDDISSIKKDYENKIISEGFLEEVEENTKVSIENILKEIGYSVVNVNFK